MVAAVSLNIFHKYTERVRMANIAQMVNVLQAMILTRDDEMVLTPNLLGIQHVHASSGAPRPCLSTSSPRR